jgi:hypothetical protein
MAVQLESFREGRDVYIDYPFEDAMFRYVWRTGQVFRKFHGEAEAEIAAASNLFHEAISAGREITAEQYKRGEPPGAGE